jgi:ADP-ribose pyrophosphatase
MYKQQQAHPTYPARGELDTPVYFTDPVVVKNMRSKDKPCGWADAFWSQMTDKEKVSVLAKVPMQGPFETREFSDESSYSGPLNPKSFTGMIGRGLLGCYGPNFAADPIVTRFNNDVLEMAAIQRGDTGEWAIPGGMVERGSTVSATLRNEFNEEALGNTLGTGDAEYAKTKEDADYTAKIKKLQHEVNVLFDNGTVVYQGWVDDPRNTDWAWMETVAMHFHIEDHSPLHGIELRPATDAKGAKWYRLDKPSDLRKLYASHGEFVLNAIKIRAETDVMWSKTLLNLVV